jgi:hypothetical protein
MRPGPLPVRRPDARPRAGSGSRAPPYPDRPRRPRRLDWAGAGCGRHRLIDRPGADLMPGIGLEHRRSSRPLPYPVPQQMESLSVRSVLPSRRRRRMGRSARGSVPRIADHLARGIGDRPRSQEGGRVAITVGDRHHGVGRGRRAGRGRARHDRRGTRHSALGTRHSALGTRHSALGTRHSAMMHLRWPSGTATPARPASPENSRKLLIAAAWPLPWG